MRVSCQSPKKDAAVSLRFECVDTDSFWHLVFGFLFPRKALMFGTVWLEVLLWKMQLIQYHSHLAQRDFFSEARSAFRLQRLEPWKGSRSCHRVTCFSASLYPYITPYRQCWRGAATTSESLFEFEADFATKRQLVRANRREEEDNSGGATSSQLEIRILSSYLVLCWGWTIWS